jgi:tRNA (cytidine/uridine-2'-O-)-methyltransferase
MPKALSSPVLNVVLVEPQIPPNTGNVARLCAASGCHLILVGELGFELSDASLKRAGLDYWAHVSWAHEPDSEAFFAALPPRAFHLFSTHATAPYTHMPVCRGDYLLFGKETSGLPKDWLARFPGQSYTIPMAGRGVRSLNLSSSVAVVVYDALRRVQPANG